MIKYHQLSYNSAKALSANQQLLASCLLEDYLNSAFLVYITSCVYRPFHLSYYECHDDPTAQHSSKLHNIEIMSGSHDAGSGAERDLQDTRDELAQASIALNTAYDRLQGLRASLRSFTAQRDRLYDIRRTRQQAHLQGDELMGPEHSAIVLSDSDEESEIDMEALREFLPSRLVESASRSGNQYTRLTAAARQVVTADSRNSSSPYSSVVPSDEPRLVYPPPPRRRRLPPPAARDGAIIPPPNAASPARRSILEAHMRHLRRTSSPSESSTSLGRRVTQRAATHAAAAGRQPTGTGTDTIVIRSTLPIGLEPRPSPLPRSLSSADLPGIESRAATHLRHSLLPNPPSGTRLSGSRMLPTSSAHSRFNDRLEQRARTAGGNSLNPASHGPSPTPAVVQESQSYNSISLRHLPPRQPTGTQLSSWEEEAPRFNFGDLHYSSSRARRRAHAQDQEQMLDPSSFEHMFLINPPVEPEFSDAPFWLRRRLQEYRSLSTHSAQSGADTDRTIHAPQPPASPGTRPTGQDGGVRRRRRGWGTSILPRETLPS